MFPLRSFFILFDCINRRVNRNKRERCACLIIKGDPICSVTIVTRIRRGLIHILCWITEGGEGLTLAAFPRHPLGPVYPLVQWIHHTFFAREVHRDSHQNQAVFCLMVTRCSFFRGKGVGASWLPHTCIY
jgi:hypothetical protein